MLELPQTAGCLVCGRENPHGLRLRLRVDPASSRVETLFTPAPPHIGFEGIVHGGLLATVLDEAMVWAATWRAKRFCLCGELTVRFRQIAEVGRELRILAEVRSVRARLAQTRATVLDPDGQTIATAEGKYVPVPPERHRRFVQTFLPDPASEPAAAVLRSSGHEPA